MSKRDDEAEDGPVEIVLPVAEERLRVARRWRERARVRVDIATHSRTEQAVLAHVAEEVSVTRVPVGRYVDAVPPARSEDGVTILPLIEEHQVVVTRLYLREEVRIGTLRRERREKRDVVLRSQQTFVRRTPAAEEMGARSASLDQGAADMSDLTNDGTYGGSGGHHLACLFASRAAAEQAVAALEKEGISRSHVDIVDAAAAGTTGGTEEGGFWESLKRFFTGDEEYHGYQEGVRRGQTLVRVRTDSAAEADRATDVLERFDPVDLNEQEAGWRSQGWAGTDRSIGAAAGMAHPHEPMEGVDPAARTGLTASSVSGSSSLIGASGAPSGTARAADDDATLRDRAGGIGGTGAVQGTTARRAGVTGQDERVIPVVEESLRVGKRDTTRGSVRVRAYTVETPVSEELRLRTERVAVERRPVDRAVTPGDETFRDRTVELTEREEEAVVAKDARVVEEVVVRKDVGERTETIRDTTRRTEVEVEDGTRLAASTSPAGGKPAGGKPGASGTAGGLGAPTGRRDGAKDDNRPRDTMQGDVRSSVHGSRGASEADPASLPPSGEYERPATGKGRPT